MSKETKQPSAIIEGISREDIMKKIAEYKTSNPDATVGVVCYDGRKEKPFWADVKSQK